MRIRYFCPYPETSMTFTFYKYQGTGNDFILIDNRTLFFSKNDTKLIARLCDRKFGIGADGLILLEAHKEADFEMVYYNADGHQSSMCGNGGRCLVAFAKALGIVKDEASFMAIDGMHHAVIKEDLVELKMQDVTSIESGQDYVFLDTGSPHHVKLQQDLDSLDVKAEGAAIRYSRPYKTNGTNVNFVSQISENNFRVRTYERGVEDETLSCGTGVTAVALAMHHQKKTAAHHLTVEVEGGRLQVSFTPSQQGYHQVYLIGPATYVFKGVWP